MNLNMDFNTFIKIVAIILVTVGSVFIIYEIVKIKRCQFIDGKVIQIIAVKRSRRRSYKPKIVYYDKNNMLKSYIPNFSSSPPMFRVNDTVKLLYDENANKREIKGILHIQHRFLFPYLILIIGATILLFSINYDLQLKIFYWIKNL